MQKSQMGENALSTAHGAMVFEPEQKSEDSEELESYPRPFAQKLKAQLLFILNIMQILTHKHVPKKKKKKTERKEVCIFWGHFVKEETGHYQCSVFSLVLKVKL